MVRCTDDSATSALTLWRVDDLESAVTATGLRGSELLGIVRRRTGAYGVRMSPADREICDRSTARAPSIPMVSALSALRPPTHEESAIFLRRIWKTADIVVSLSRPLEVLSFVVETRAVRASAAAWQAKPTDARTFLRPMPLFAIDSAEAENATVSITVLEWAGFFVTTRTPAVELVQMRGHDPRDAVVCHVMGWDAVASALLRYTSIPDLGG
jgi:hypothetical protein